MLVTNTDFLLGKKGIAHTHTHTHTHTLTVFHISRMSVDPLNLIMDSK